MPRETQVKSGTPSKSAENQASTTLTRSQPSTSEEVQARTGRPEITTPEVRDDETGRELRKRSVD